MIDTGEAISQFTAAMREAGIDPPESIEADGCLHRFGTNGQRGDDAGYYVVHLDGTPAGHFGDWRKDVSESWRADIGRSLSPAEDQAHKRRMKALRRQRSAEEQRRHAEARERAAAIWGAARPAPADHVYLTTKGVKAHGIKAHEGRLVIPVAVGGAIRSLQFISGDGSKRFLPGGEVAGGYYAIGKPEGVICIAEGYATAATIHEVTGHAAAVAFNGGNLEPVSKELRAKFPDLRMIVCADDDAATEGNPGLAKATAAARAVGADLALPDFGEDRPEGCTDFNDLARLRGPRSVRAAIAAAGNTDAADDPYGVSLIPASGLKPEPISWLWDGWLAVGKLHVLAGAPGTGKTTLAMAFAATITTGGRWPDSARAEVGDVVIWSGEDDPRDTLIPRLIACGADLNRVRFVGGVQDQKGSRTFDPAMDAEMLSDAISERPPALLIVDPIVSAAAGDSHKNAEVRRSLQPLVDLAQSRRCAVLGISHFSKGSKGADPVERVTGSLAFGALARIVLAAAKLPDEEGGGRMLARAKSNIGLDHGGYKYDLDVYQIDAGIETTRVLWAEALEGTARELLSKAEAISDPEEHGALEDAKAFLTMLLEDAPIPATQVRRESDQAGHAWATIRRAKDVLGIEARREGGLGKKGAWKWHLTAKVLKDPYVAHTQGVSILGKNEHLRDSPTPGDDDREVF